VQATPPSPALARQVELFFWSQPTRNEHATSFYEFLPDSSPNLIFRFTPSRARMVLLGPATEKATIELDAAAFYLGIRFRTGQAPRLADIHPAEAIDGFIELPGLFGERADSLADRLLSAPDHPARIALLEQLLHKGAPAVRSERCRKASLLVDARGGQVRVEELADAFGVHVRSLERLFRDELGLSPKRLARLVRFRRVLARLTRRDYPSLTDLAYACGYADQSHLIHDFKELTGRVPGDKDAFRAQPLEEALKAGPVHRYR